uniref:Uncharacterized protein n=1 Tax=Chromera velia CCMP2878 TaxID=1169474 RepID=A0A0G4I4G4_9ALVE|eukprot:Cvel_1804.t1-p1 / transcript=Cvel_1804.t1 / gene=Cvel_1804 / organism=Chromera_velia_CCMP2878 / gene_product=hypothetical protein / transcript_product=hypothetical protein / location=Cvel_scaffold66:89731-91617(+) / protein_length=629 / sequence_SO=supercontig / SO=protein_coding / is_pseudo=false
MWALTIGAGCRRPRKPEETDDSAKSIAQEAAVTLSQKWRQFLASPDPAPVSGVKAFATANSIKLVNVIVQPTRPDRLGQSTDLNCRYSAPLHFVVVVSGTGLGRLLSPGSGGEQAQKPVRTVYKIFRQALVNLLSEDPDFPSLNLAVNRDTSPKTKSQLVFFHTQDTGFGGKHFQADRESHDRLNDLCDEVLQAGGSLARLSFEFCMNDVEGLVEGRVAEFVKKVESVLGDPPSPADASTLPTPQESNPNSTVLSTFTLNPDRLCQISCCGREVGEDSEAAEMQGLVRCWSNVIVFAEKVGKYGGRFGKNDRPGEGSLSASPRNAAPPPPLFHHGAAAAASAATAAAAQRASPSAVLRTPPGAAALVGDGIFVRTSASMECQKEEGEGGGGSAELGVSSASGDGQPAGQEGLRPGKRSCPVEGPSQASGAEAATQGGGGAEAGAEEGKEEEEEEEEDDVVCAGGEVEGTGIGGGKRRRRSTKNKDPDGGGGQSGTGGGAAGRGNSMTGTGVNEGSGGTGGGQGEAPGGGAEEENKLNETLEQQMFPDDSTLASSDPSRSAVGSWPKQNRKESRACGLSQKRTRTRQPRTAPPRRSPRFLEEEARSSGGVTGAVVGGPHGSAERENEEEE